VLAKIIETFQA